jgi:Phosphatidylglycerol lysyltransferase, C-terminal
MSSIDLSSGSLSPHNTSRPSSLSSATTLRDDDLQHHTDVRQVQNETRARAGNNTRANTRNQTKNRPARQPNKNPRGQRQELGYEKVLRNMITEPKEVPVSIPVCPTTVSNLKATINTQLNSERHTAPSVGRKFIHARKTKAASPICHITDQGVASSLEKLMANFGCGTHSSFLDDNYSIYMPEPEQAAICFKVVKKAAIMYGDPLCAVDQVENVFQAFHRFCKKQGWHLAVVGARPALTAFSQKKSWKTMEVAVEQVFNPMTNTVLDETSGKTINRTNRKLVASGVILYLYDPSRGRRLALEQELTQVYETWKEEKGKRYTAQAYSAVIDPFCMPAVSRYLYTCGEDGRPNSLAGMIQLGANKGYLLEPCVQLPGAPKGTTGFLATHALGLMRNEGVTYATFGFEALPEIGEMSRMPSMIEDTSRRFYRSTFNTLGLLGRKEFHESFHPDDTQQVPLYILFPPGLPRISVYQGVLNATNISPYEVWRRSRAAKAEKAKQDKPTLASQPSPPVIDVRE